MKVMGDVQLMVKLTINGWSTFSLKHIHFGILSCFDTILTILPSLITEICNLVNNKCLRKLSQV